MSTIKATVTTSQQLPSWVDEFLDASSPRRDSHRSYASDPITFLDTQFLDECWSSDHGAVMAGTAVHEYDQLSKNEGWAAAAMEPPSATPRRVKRILANRQSAQRSRVRKLQYISELERSVTSLQTEVSTLSPRVAFLDHQRLILNADNSTMKQRIAALAQDKIFKDAHQEALKKEIERLWQIYHHQNLHKMGNSVNHSGHSPGSPPPSQSQPPYSTTSAANSISALGM